MPSAESAEVGELLLVQALRSLHANPDEIGEEHWKRFHKGDSSRSREEVLADIGLGKRLAVVVAKKLLASPEGPPESGRRLELDHHPRHGGPRGPVAAVLPPSRATRSSRRSRRGRASSCTPTTARPSIPSTSTPEKWVDVQWDAAPGRLFDALNVRLTAANQRGVLARLAAEISEADSNIDHIETEERATSAYTTIVFMIQVRSRMHLAQVFRRLRRIPEVVRLSRLKRQP